MPKTLTKAWKASRIEWLSSFGGSRQKTMKKIVLGFVLVCLLSVGCGGEKESGQPKALGVNSQQQAAKTYTIGFSQCTFEDPWRINMNKEMEAAAAIHPEIKLVIANGENRNAKQIADMENFIASGVDAIIISPREAAPLTEVVAKAYERGIPMVVLDRRVLGDKYTAFIGASNLEIGKAAGDHLTEILPGRGKVVEIEGILGATATQERHDGFHYAIDNVGWIEVVCDQPGNYKRSPARQIMDNALQANPHIDAVYAHNDEMAIGAFLAAQAVGREKDITFIGIDGQSEAVSMIRQGVIHATFLYPSGAAEAVELVLSILQGGAPPAKEITLKTTLITKNAHPEYKGF
jgi:ribose transport system substrate-binding protein